MEYKRFFKIHIILYPLIFILAFSLGSFYGNKMLIELGFSELLNGPAPKLTASDNLATPTSLQDTNNLIQETHNISGSIRSVDKELITIKTSDDKIVSIKLDSKTKLYKGVPKDPKVIEKTTSELSGAQEPFTKKEEALADFKEGDLIIATSDKNVKNMTSFVALEILLLQKPNLQNTGR